MPKNVSTLIAEGIYQIQHGDYQRIANLCHRGDGRPFTADYVRKVLLGLRQNSTIEKKALRYLKKQKKLMETLSI